VKVFVSGKIGDEEEARSTMASLIRRGYEITLDWTTIPHLKPYQDNSAASSDAAFREVAGVLDADALIVIPHEHGVGMYVELGVALGAGKPVYVITSHPSKTMFFYHPLVKIVASLDELFQFLELQSSLSSPE